METGQKGFKPIDKRWVYVRPVGEISSGFQQSPNAIAAGHLRCPFR